MEEIGEMIEGYALTDEDVLSREGELDITKGVVEFHVSLKFKIPSFLRVEQGKNCENIKIIFHRGQRLGALLREVSPLKKIDENNSRKCDSQIFLLEENLVKKLIEGKLNKEITEFIKKVIQEEQKLTKYIHDHPSEELLEEENFLIMQK